MPYYRPWGVARGERLSDHAEIRGGVGLARPIRPAADDADGALVIWMEREEILFRTLERHVVGARIKQGFGDDVDEFVRFSLSVHNRRKSRAGYALENHLERVLQACGVRYPRGQKTENQARPDFIFPGIDAYHTEGFPVQLLSMLGVKSNARIAGGRCYLKRAKSLRSTCSQWSLESARTRHPRCGTIR